MNIINDYTDETNTKIIECPVCLQEGISTRKHKPVDGVDLGEIHRVCDSCLPILQRNGEICPFNCGATLSLRGRLTVPDQETVEKTPGLKDLQVKQVWQESKEVTRLQNVKKRGLNLTFEERNNIKPKKLF